MVNSLIALGLAGLAAAAPSHSLARRQAPNYPPHSQSTGFYLIANVTDPSKDFTPSINGYALTSYHSGAGTAYGVLAAPPATTSTPPGRVFYENGTAYEVRYGQADVLSDGGTPSFPEGLIVQNSSQFSAVAGQHETFINAGAGTKGVGLAGFPSPIPSLYAAGVSGWAVCNNTLLYGAAAFQLEPTFATYTDSEGNYDYQANVPEGCAPVTMLPQCATLPEVPAGGIASHEYAATVSCYDDVKGIDWTVYSAA